MMSVRIPTLAVATAFALTGVLTVGCSGSGSDSAVDPNNPEGQPPVNVPTPPDGGAASVTGYQVVPPVRVLDTRASAVVAAGTSQCVQVADVYGVPADAKAVFVGIVAVAPAASGYLVAYPAGTGVPVTSSGNYVMGRTTSANAIVEVGTDGSICVFTLAETHVVLDLFGYFGADSEYQPVAAFRAVDTRIAGVMAAPGSVTCVDVVGEHGIPANAKAVSFRLSAVDPAAAGYAKVYPGAAPAPADASTLNYATAVNASNHTIAEVGSDGTVCVYVTTAAHLIIDIAGYFAESSVYTPIAAFRRVDSRGAEPAAADSTVCLQIAGQNDVPADAYAVAINITAVGSVAPGFVTAYAQGSSAPATSSLNYTDAQWAIANSAVVEIGTNGNVCLFFLTETDYIVDVSGYWR